MARPETTFSEIRSWQFPRQGRITQTVRGSHVEITVRLGRAAGRIWATTVAIATMGAIFFGIRIVELFLSGTAARIIDAASRAH